MSTFRDKLSGLLSKITGKTFKTSPKRTSIEELRPNKHTTSGSSTESAKPATAQPCIGSKAQPRPTAMMATSDLPFHGNAKHQKERSAYFFQIGFDFGTSSSKAVIRDINTNRAWVYTGSSDSNRPTFLIPSVVVYRNGKLRRHLDVDTFYPDGGLYHLKMAIEKVAHGDTGDPIFEEYKKVLGADSPYDSVQITKLACIYLLASIFSGIIESIIHEFPNYGQKEDDQMGINMAIPVASISDQQVRLLFEEILNISWLLAWDRDFSLKNSSVDALLHRIKKQKKMSNTQNYNGLCHVYPEVSANVQAFINSPASSPDETTIYFFSDTGAGTVDQSVFTYAGIGRKRLNYFSAGVFPRGSSQIEITACGSDADERQLEYWRKEKESGTDSPVLNNAKIIVGEALKNDTQKTLRGTVECLCQSESVSPENTLKEKIKFIFSGGGYSKFPYQDTIVGGYHTFLRANIDPVVTSIARPTDLDIPQGCENWITRLYVAYGLSFLFEELAENTFPSENKIYDKIDNNTMLGKPCTCKGINIRCSKCFGTGIIQ